jgi:hypothetical protein
MLYNELKKNRNNLYHIWNTIEQYLKNPNKNIEHYLYQGKLNRANNLYSEIKSNPKDVVEAINSEIDSYSRSGDQDGDEVKVKVKNILSDYGYNPEYYNITVSYRKRLIDLNIRHFSTKTDKGLGDNVRYFTIDIKSSLSPYLKIISFLLNVNDGLNKYNTNLKKRVEELEKNNTINSEKVLTND